MIQNLDKLINYCNRNTLFLKMSFLATSCMCISKCGFKIKRHICTSRSTKSRVLSLHFAKISAEGESQKHVCHDMAQLQGTRDISWWYVSGKKRFPVRRFRNFATNCWTMQDSRRIIAKAHDAADFINRVMIYKM